MKKAFTLVELLIVVVVIVTLMTIVFKLAGVGDDAADRNKTINRMQRLENCLSGYYAAYGSYPPVKLHGSRDYTVAVDDYGIQDPNESKATPDSGNGTLNWNSVEAACRSQPIAMSFPYHESMKDYIKTYSQLRAKGDPSKEFEALYNNSTISSLGGKSEWSEVQVYKFGVLSYLLPRYLVIMYDYSGDSSSKKLDDQLFTEHRQWTDNNQLPPDFDTGMPYTSWSDVNSDANSDPWKIAAIPSQAACARWLPNLEGIVHTLQRRPIYGVTLYDPDNGSVPDEIHSVGGYNVKSQPYALDTLTVRDAFWDDKRQRHPEFYYYSPPPHQSYRLWSSGKNARTFPPWVTNEELSSLSDPDRKTVQEWISDDIVHMSN